MAFCWIAFIVMICAVYESHSSWFSLWIWYSVISVFMVVRIYLCLFWSANHTEVVCCLYNFACSCPNNGMRIWVLTTNCFFPILGWTRFSAVVLYTFYNFFSSGTRCFLHLFVIQSLSQKRAIVVRHVLCWRRKCCHCSSCKNFTGRPREVGEDIVQQD